MCARLACSWLSVCVPPTKCIYYVPKEALQMYHHAHLFNLNGVQQFVTAFARISFPEMGEMFLGRPNPKTSLKN